MAVQTRRVQAAISENRTWFIILGILLIILGVAAIAFPLLTTIAVKIALGWLFLVGGIVQIAHAFSTKQWSEFFLDFLVGLLYLVVGRLAGSVSTYRNSDTYLAASCTVHSSRHTRSWN